MTPTGPPRHTRPMTASIYTVDNDILGSRLGPAVLIRDNLGICYADDIPHGTPADGLALVVSDADVADFLHVVTVRMPKTSEPNVAWFEMESAPAGTPVAIHDLTGVGSPVQAMRRAKRILDGSYHRPAGAQFAQPMGVWCTWFGLFC